MPGWDGPRGPTQATSGLDLLQARPGLAGVNKLDRVEQFGVGNLVPVRGDGVVRGVESVVNLGTAVAYRL